MLLLFSLPSSLYIAIRSLRGTPLSESLAYIGWKLCHWKDVLRALAAFALLAAITFFVLRLIPNQVLTSSSPYLGKPLSARSVLTALLYEALYVALGEEVFFRGFLASWLFRRIGFQFGNLVQATIFLLPHLLLLTISSQIWPVFIVQFIAGWLQGWLLCRSQSILPGWLVHTASNLASAISVMA